MAARKKKSKAKKTKAKKRTTTKRKTAKKVKRKTAKTKAKKRTTKRAKAKTKAKRTTTTTAKAIKTGPIGKVSKMYTKSTLLTTLSERTGLSRKEVGTVIEELVNVVEAHVKRGGPGKFTLPGVLKMTVKNVPARKARKGINPFTGEPTIFKAKPASRKVKVTPLKALKEMAS